jgi:hypothetical protein
VELERGSARLPRARELEAERAIDGGRDLGTSLREDGDTLSVRGGGGEESAEDERDPHRGLTRSTSSRNTPSG